MYNYKANTAVIYTLYQIIQGHTVVIVRFVGYNKKNLKFGV